MPRSTRRQAQTQRGEQVDIARDDLDLLGRRRGAAAHSDEIADVEAGEDNEQDIEGALEEELDDEDEDDEDDDLEDDLDDEDASLPPPGLKEISALASWTVSSAKPGNGVAALRAADTRQYWQSDGPQPHLLSIHFFKRVAIAHMRIFLDFAADESYTPTKIQFLAGSGVHDVLEFAEMSFEQPCGWIDVDFSSVGPPPSADDDEDDDNGNNNNSADRDAPPEIDWSKRPVLRAFLVQIRILENHQNGKDTHLRAVQLFARDESVPSGRERRGGDDDDDDVVVVDPRRHKHAAQLRDTRPSSVLRKPPNNIRLASWMTEPDLR